MVYTCKYKSPLGDILLAADAIGLTGLWFEGQKYFAKTLPDEHISQETAILTEAKKWLDVYFTGEEPQFTPPLHPAGSEFRQDVWQILRKFRSRFARRNDCVSKLKPRLCSFSLREHMSPHARYLGTCRRILFSRPYTHCTKAFSNRLRDLSACTIHKLFCPPRNLLSSSGLLGVCPLWAGRAL